MEISAGIVIRNTNENKLLVVKATGKHNRDVWTFPKGHVQTGESFIDAAVRETFEEIGILVPVEKLKDFDCVRYKNKSNTTYKKVYLFLYDIDSYEEIGLTEGNIPKDMLQLDEVCEGVFLDKTEFEGKVLRHYKKCWEDLEDKFGSVENNH